MNITRATIALTREAVAQGRRMRVPFMTQPMVLLIPDEEPAYVTEGWRSIEAHELIAFDHKELEDMLRKTLRFLGAMDQLMEDCPFCKDKPYDIHLMGNPVKFKHRKDCPLQETLGNLVSIMNPDKPINLVPNELRGWDGPKF